MVNSLILIFLTLWVAAQKINCDPEDHELTKGGDPVDVAIRSEGECATKADCKGERASCVNGVCLLRSRNKRAYDEIVTDCPEELTILINYRIPDVQWNDQFANRDSQEYNDLRTPIETDLENQDIAFLSRILSIVFEKDGNQVIAHIRLLLAPPQRLMKMMSGKKGDLVKTLGIDGLVHSMNGGRAAQIHRDTHPKIGEACYDDIPCSIANSECSTDGVCECSGGYIEIPGTIDQCYKGLSGDCKINADCRNHRASCIHGKCWIGSIRKRLRRGYNEIHTDCKEGITILIKHGLTGIPWDDNLKIKDSDEYQALYDNIKSYIENTNIPYMKKLLSVVFEKGEDCIIVHARFLMAVSPKNKSKRSLEGKSGHEQTVKQFHIDRKLARAADAMKLDIGSIEITVLEGELPG